MTACLRAFSQDAVVGFEAGTLTQYLTYGLQAAGFEAVYMEARQVAAALSAMRNKTDQIPRPGQPMAWPRLGIVWNVLLNKHATTVPKGPVPVDTLTRAELEAAPDRSLSRLGHSTVLIKLRGGFWITDPVFAQRASPA